MPTPSTIGSRFPSSIGVEESYARGVNTTHFKSLTSVPNNLTQTNVHVPCHMNIPTPKFENAMCSQLSTDLQWTSLSDDSNYYYPGFYTVGTVLNMPPQDSTGHSGSREPPGVWQ